MKKREDFLVFGSPLIGEEEIGEVVETLRSGWIGTGPRVARFEEEISRYKHAPYVAAVNSCTAALHLSMLAANLKPGDEVITTPLTFCATINAIIHAGATPVLADIDPDTMNIDPECVHEKIGTRTRAVLPVHFAGRSCNMDALVAITQEHNLVLIEDCAHALETEYHGKKTGTFGDFGCLSFYVTKNVVTGEGGMVLAARDEDIRRIKVLALHGMSADAWKRFSDEGYKHYSVVCCGYKYNMMDIQAAIGLHQLNRVEQCWERRQSLWRHYLHTLAGLPLTLPAPAEEKTRHAYHLFTILVDKEQTGISRDRFVTELTRKNIGAGIHYLSIPEHPYYRQRFGWRPEDYPHAMRTGRQTVSLPLSPKLSVNDLDDVTGAITDILDSC